MVMAISAEWYEESKKNNKGREKCIQHDKVICETSKTNNKVGWKFPTFYQELNLQNVTKAVFLAEQLAYIFFPFLFLLKMSKTGILSVFSFQSMKNVTI